MLNMKPLSPAQNKIRNMIRYGPGCGELALGYLETTDRLMYIQTEIIDALDLPRWLPSLEEFAEVELEGKLKSTFRCACGKPVSISSYMADGAIETETRCSCGRRSDHYRGYHDRGPGPTLMQIKMEHNK